MRVQQPARENILSIICKLSGNEEFLDIIIRESD